MATRLKSFELQGYKTFANKTIFEFPQPITAIIGPNGSGKSNIADALRWVLGEQSFSLLRGKRTEDMIFSGSEHRHRAGMASATIVFDNHDHWLPIDFEEVAISRRAYRDGTNEYLINGQKVRLRDVSDLLGRSGLSERTYTIIGQGLVDAALALKAEERRRLFEEAAGIGVYRTRRDEALRRLEQTKWNLQRVEDILSELQPRLQSLERQAQRAKEFNLIKNELHATLREWYGYHWHKTQRELSRAIELARVQEKHLQEARQKQAGLEAKIFEIREHIQTLRTKLNEWQRGSAELHARKEEISRKLAVSDERQQYLTKQAQEIQLNISTIRGEIDLLQAKITNDEETIDLKKEELNDIVEQRRELSVSLQKLFDELGTLQHTLGHKRQQYIDLIGQLSENRARQNEMVSTRTEILERLDQSQLMIDSFTEQRDRLIQAIAGEEKKLNKITADILRLSKQINRAEAKLEKLRSKRDLITSTINTERTLLTGLKAQLDVLESAEQNLVGFEAGTRLLFEASQKSSLLNLRGVLGLSIEVPEEYQKAISASLGENLEAILLADKSSLNTALSILENQPAKSILLPLSDLFPYGEIDTADISSEILASASDVVSAPKEIETAIRLLLDSTYIVKDREVAWQVIQLLRRNVGNSNRPDIRIVTLQGEVFSLQGLVRTDGGSGEEIFIRKNEKRSIGNRIEQVQKNISIHEARLSKIDVETQQVQTQLDFLSAELDRVHREEGDIRRLIQEESIQLSAVQHQLEWNLKVVESLQEQIASLNTSLPEIEQRIEELVYKSEAVQNEIEKLETEIRELSLSDLQENLARIRTKEALVEQSLEACIQRRLEYEKQLNEKKDLLEKKESERETIGISMRELKSQIEEYRSLEHECALKLLSLTELIKPTEKELEESESALRTQELEVIEAHKLLSQFEHSYAQARIALTRQEELLNNLRRRIEDDFGLVAFDYASEISGPTPLPLEGLVEELPKIESLSPAVEESLRRQKALLRRIGPINAEAEKEYEEVRARTEFMQSQLNDLRQAELDVRRVIQELDQIMEHDFKVTFDAVADEFHKIFNRLFGGGSARLVMTDPDDPTNTGIDIEAKLPGRREQGLSLLSGGERSLTAVALVFALLKVSPTPFCVLDEVDAMLDEANVSRFGDLLRELSQTTQFLIITHNRATVQLADVIYGVTMGKDSTSQTLSLKMDEISQVI